LGKITEDNGFIPSHKNELREKATEIPKVDIKTYGIYAIFEALLRDEAKHLQDIFGKETAEAVLSFALMRWAYHSPIKRLAYYHSHDFCSEFWGDGKLLSDKIITEILKNIGENREKVLDWMKQLLPSSQANHLVLMDSTHVMSESENLGINVPGYNPEFDFGKQIRLMYMFSQNFKRPIYYRMINGNIPDVSSISACIDEIGKKDIILVADKGFYSAQNVEALTKKQVKFIIPLHRNNKAINYAPLLQNDFKRQNGHFLYQKRVIWHYSYELEGQKYVTYLDDKLRVEEEQNYLLKVEGNYEGYTMDNYYAHLHTFGTLTVTYDTDDDVSSPQQLFEIYKQRNEIEVMFDGYKNFLEADRTYMQNRYVLEGWLFVNFLAMLAYYKLFDRLRSAKLLAKISPKDVIERSKAIYQMRIRGEWSRMEMPVKAKRLYKTLGIDNLT
jgi:transposase